MRVRVRRPSRLNATSRCLAKVSRALTLLRPLLPLTGPPGKPDASDGPSGAPRDRATPSGPRRMNENPPARGFPVSSRRWRRNSPPSSRRVQAPMSFRASVIPGSLEHGGRRCTHTARPSTSADPMAASMGNCRAGVAAIQPTPAASNMSTFPMTMAGGGKWVSGSPMAGAVTLGAEPTRACATHLCHRQRLSPAREFAIPGGPNTSLRAF